jgi:hypothetical protein
MLESQRGGIRLIINNIFENWTKGCYIASLIKTEEDDNGNEINYYAKPKPYEFNVQPANGDTDVVLYGERISKMYNVEKDEFVKMIGGTDMIKYDVRMRKALEFLKEN